MVLLRLRAACRSAGRVSSTGPGRQIWIGDRIARGFFQGKQFLVATLEVGASGRGVYKKSSIGHSADLAGFVETSHVSRLALFVLLVLLL